jgi:DNA-binding helix-hairpin-helix protein with protein kinase domain
MNQLIGSNNAEYALGKRQGGGGEGDVFALEGNPHFVAKIFKEGHRQHGKELKLLAMLDNPVPSGSPVAWPVDILYENNSFVGYVMPNVTKNKALNLIYDQDGGLGFNLYHRITVAGNLCLALNAVHTANHVCGDMNPENILVSNECVVTLIDTDSYQIHKGKQTYRCKVAFPNCVAPELGKRLGNGADFDSLDLPTFTKETDLYGLALHIFALLMNGCHAFATALTPLALSGPSIPNPRIPENTNSGNSAFFVPSQNYTIPKYAPALQALPEEIQELFKRAFVNGYADPSQRPACSEWYNALHAWRDILPPNAPLLPAHVPEQTKVTVVNNLYEEEYASEDEYVKADAIKTGAKILLLCVLIAVFAAFIVAMAHQVLRMLEQEQLLMLWVKINGYIYKLAAQNTWG